MARHLAIGCLVALALLPACLSYEGFLEKRLARKCEQQEVCNPDIPCFDVDTGEVPPDDCDFDAGMARQCLAGAWTCDDRFVGFEVPIPPQACATVCGGL